jgi:hypothetical protein
MTRTPHCRLRAGAVIGREAPMLLGPRLRD